MQTFTVVSDQIKLPPEVVRQLKGKEIEFIKYHNGFIIQPITDCIKGARGILKKKRFSTERFFQMKQEEKTIEK